MLWTACVLLVCVFVAGGAAQGQLGLYEDDICKQDGGTLWTCKKPLECPKAKENWQKGKRPEVCSFQGKVPIVCCEPEVKVSPVGVKSKQMCEKYAEAVFTKVSNGFGSQQNLDLCAAAEPLIIGGKEAKPREYPHMALIGYGEKSSISWLCGGSLISERFVMSAAHCTTITKGPARWVRLGEYNVQSTLDNKDGTANPVEYEIIERINHPEYQSSSVYRDIALYKLAKDVTFNEFIRPACLQTEHNFPKSYAIATGWGKTDYSNSKGSDILMKVNLTLTPRKECAEHYELAIGPKLSEGIKDESMICAGDLKNGKDTCNGDSGGPLQLRLRKPYCMYSVLGVVSFGPRDCGGGSHPGVYSRVSHYVPWIESIVWP